MSDNEQRQRFGAYLAQLRRRTGMSQSKMATRLSALSGTSSVTRNEVSRWERGERIPGSWLPLLANALDRPVTELERAASYARRATGGTLPEYAVTWSGLPVQPPPLARTVDCDDSLVTVDSGEGLEPVNRRELVGTALGLGLASEPWGRLSFALSGKTVDAVTADEAVRRTAAMFAAEERLPASQLYRSLATHLDHLTVLLSSAGKYRTPLLVAAGETAALAGWLAFDMGDLPTARRYYDTATRAGHEAAHPPVRALVSAYASYAVNDPMTARDMLRVAQQQLKGTGSATARSWVSAREAEEAATASDREGALRAVERAQTVYDYARPEEEQAWVHFFSRARLDSMTVAAYARLDHPDLAEVSDAALASLQPSDAKTRAVILGDVAGSYVLRGEFERGAEVARDALHVTLKSQATLGRERLSTLASQLPTKDGPARELADELRAALL